MSFGIKKTDVERIIDVGASISETTNNYLDWFPCSSVVTFEPLTSNLKGISERYENPWIFRVVHLRPFALSDQEARKCFHESKLESICDDV
jgi:hypothetical protein